MKKSQELPFTFSGMGVHYGIKKLKETFGAIELDIECMENPEQTIDQILNCLKDQKNTRILEVLCPYFGILWPSSRALSSHLSSLPDDQWRGRRVLELGCGLAIPSMVAAKKGARVTATDFHPEVSKFLVKNRESNSLEDLQFKKIDWEEEDSSLGRFDWILGSDILYEGKHPQVFSQAIFHHLEKGGKALITDPGRNYLQAFADIMFNLGFSYTIDILMDQIFLLVLERGQLSSFPVRKGDENKSLL